MEPRLARLFVPAKMGMILTLSLNAWESRGYPQAVDKLWISSIAVRGL